jgi:hypothetical protein
VHADDGVMDLRSGSGEQPATCAGSVERGAKRMKETSLIFTSSSRASPSSSVRRDEGERHQLTTTAMTSMTTAALPRLFNSRTREPTSRRRSDDVCA